MGTTEAWRTTRWWGSALRAQWAQCGHNKAFKLLPLSARPLTRPRRPQVSSKHCRLLRVGCKELAESHAALVRPRSCVCVLCAPPSLQSRGLSRHPQAQEAAQENSGVLAFIVDNASTNGTFVNGARLGAHVPFPLCHDDLVTFASADPAGPKCVALRFQRYDPALYAQGAVPRGAAAGAGEASPQAGVKRARLEGGGDPAQALALHAENQALRDKASALQEQLSLATAKAAGDAAAANKMAAALQEALDTSLAAAKRQQEEAEVAASEAAEVAKASLLEAQADQARAAAAAHAAGQAEAAAAEARDERDGALARLRERQAELDAARAELRAHIDSAVSVTAGQASTDAALTSARAEKEAALRRADHATAEAQAAQSALAAEKANRAAAEAAAAASAEQVAALEARLARMQDEARGEREGTALKFSLQVDMAASILAAAATLNAALPHARALLGAEWQPAAPGGHVGKGDSQRGSGMGLGLPTQRVPLTAPPPPGFGGPARGSDTQLVEQLGHTTAAGDDAVMALAEEEHLQAEDDAVAPLPRISDAAELVLLSPGVGLDGAAHQAAAHGPDNFAFDDENGPASTYPSASMQAKMEAEAAKAMSDAGRRNSAGAGWDAF